MHTRVLNIHAYALKHMQTLLVHRPTQVALRTLPLFLHTVDLAWAFRSRRVWCYCCSCWASCLTKLLPVYLNVCKLQTLTRPDGKGGGDVGYSPPVIYVPEFHNLQKYFITNKAHKYARWYLYILRV